MGTRLIRVLVALIVASVWASPAKAQTARITASGGYQFLNAFPSDSSDGGSQTFEKGWYADISGSVTRNVAAVFQVGGSYTTLKETQTSEGFSASMKLDLSLYQFLGGVRMTAHPPNAPVKPFAHALFGAARVGGSGEVTFTGGGLDTTTTTSSGTAMTKAAMQLGGGVDFMFTEAFGVRAGADYGHIFNSSDNGGGLNMFRFAVGGVFPF